jgi:pyruvate dehydrogenase phosphatase
VILRRVSLFVPVPLLPTDLDVFVVLGQKCADGKWSVDVLSSYHNGEDPDEAERVTRAHPGEENCIQNQRVFGLMALTRGA